MADEQPRRDWTPPWDEGENELEWAREDFAHRMRDQYVKDIVVLVFIALLGVFCGWLAFRSESLLFVVVPIAVPLVAFGPYVWLVVSRMRRQRTEPPDSIDEYIGHVRHNLDLQERELRWAQWFLAPICVLFGFAMIALSWFLGLERLTEQPVLGITILGVTSLVPVALYLFFNAMPAKFAEEREQLEGIADVTGSTAAPG